MLVYKTLESRWKVNPSASLPLALMKKPSDGVWISGTLHTPLTPLSTGTGSETLSRSLPRFDTNTTLLSTPGGFRPEHFRSTCTGAPEEYTHTHTHCVGNETHPQNQLLSDDLSPLTGRSRVLLNSVTADVENPALKSRLLTPVTRSVCRPLHATYTNITHLTIMCEICKHLTLLQDNTSSWTPFLTRADHYWSMFSLMVFHNL